MLHQLMDPKGEFLEISWCVDGRQKINTSKYFGKIQYYFVVLFVTKENNLVVDIIHVD